MTDTPPPEVAALAWPPTIPPSNRTDDTPMATTHASDHNALARALTDVVANAVVSVATATWRQQDANAGAATLSVDIGSQFGASPVTGTALVVVNHELYLENGAASYIQAYLSLFGVVGGRTTFYVGPDDPVQLPPGVNRWMVSPPLVAVVPVAAGGRPAVTLNVSHGPGNYCTTRGMAAALYVPFPFTALPAP